MYRRIILTIFFFFQAQAQTQRAHELLLRYPAFLSEIELLQEPIVTLSPDPITIFVHGTNLTPATRKFFHSAPLGLSRVPNIQSSASLLYKALIRLPKADPEFCSLENFFIFTWNGKLSFAARERAGALLHEAITNLVQKYTIAGIPVPPITIITHSHGGNVALNLVPASGDNTYTIRRLILLACPVQAKTEPYVHNNLFERVYSFYSKIDLLQIADPQELYKEYKLSKRCFKYNPRVKQVCIQYNKRSPMHIEFLVGSFWYYIPQIITEVDRLDECDTPDCSFVLQLKI